MSVVIDQISDFLNEILISNEAINDKVRISLVEQLLQSRIILNKFNILIIIFIKAIINMTY